jgi:hypothetical protein
LDGDGGAEIRPSFPGEGGVEGFFDFCDGLFVSPTKWLVCATFPMGLSMMVRRLGVLIAVSFLSRLIVRSLVRSRDSRGELGFLLNGPINLVNKKIHS